MEFIEHIFILTSRFRQILPSWRSNLREV